MVWWGVFLSHLCRKVSQSFAKGGGICIGRSRELQEAHPWCGVSPSWQTAVQPRLQRSLRLWSSLSAAGFEHSRYGSARIPALWSWSGCSPVSPASDLTAYRPNPTMSADTLFAQILGILSKSPFHSVLCGAVLNS